MRRRIAGMALLPMLALLGGCGSSEHSASTPRAATASTPSANTAALPTTTASAPSSSGGTRPPATSAATTTGSPSPTRPTSPAGEATHVRLPATFTIRAGGALSPPSVSSPAFLAIQLTVASADGRPHVVVLRTPTPHSLTVPGDGRASVFVGGLRAGRYVLLVDGVVRGALIVGGEPGP